MTKRSITLPAAAALTFLIAGCGPSGGDDPADAAQAAPDDAPRKQA